ncbi:MAG: protein phosphatase 2C domain-containing protein [Armatimonadetes bacterium]|nr:protein phosphatase 2C domain-containing protein [Armatimonadota bacterium]
MKIFGFNSARDAAPQPNDIAATQDDVAAPQIDIEEEQDEAALPQDEVVGEQSEAPPQEADAPEPQNDVALAEPPRALPAGSFLKGEYEIKEVVSRGFINYYLADAGDYGAHDFKLVAQRNAPPIFIEDGPDAPFFPPATRFLQDENEFAIWDWQNLKSLDDWSAHPNDEIYLGVVGEVARGLFALENAGLAPDLARESLFFDAAGQLKCFGFFDAGFLDAIEAGLTPSPNSDAVAANEGLEEAVIPASPTSAIHQLSALSSRFAKTQLAAGATLRLDDEFGALPFSEEVKTFARSLNEGEFRSAGEVVAALEGFAPVGKTQSDLLCDVGMERELNEDCGLIWKMMHAGHERNFAVEVLAVADGMGGHEGGEVASDLTLSSLQNLLLARQNLDWNDNALILKALDEILSEVNQSVVRLTENPPYASMRNKPGSTLVCALRVGSRAFIGNVGDSRAYRWNQKSGLERLTRDHSYVQDLLDAGSISEDEAWGHPDGSVITSHIGMMRGMKKDVLLRLLSRGDKLVLVSDGVVDTLRDAQIGEIIAAHDEVSGLCAALVNAANEAGGIDNITVAALFCA